MKNFIKISFAFFIGLLVFSCTTDENLATISEGSNATLKSDKSSLVLKKDDADKNAITFTWTNPLNGLNLAYTNQLQIALKGTNFANAKNVDLGTAISSRTYKTEEFNAILLSLGVPFDKVTDLEVRVKSNFTSVDGSAILPAPTYSAVLPLAVTPYALVSYLYAVGAFQGWNINNADRLASATSNGIYIGYLNFSEANSEFLIVPVNNNNGYNDKYGSNDNVNLIKAGGNNLKAVNAGQQRITVNLNTLKYNLDPYAMGIVGSGTPGGWDEGAEDIPMEYDFAIMKWKATATFKTGEIKFRTNREWSENYGGSNGVLNDGNIPITAGVHTVTLDLVNRVYTVN